MCGALFDGCSGGAEPAERLFDLRLLRLCIRILSLADLVKGVLSGGDFRIKVAEVRLIPFESGRYGGQTATLGAIFTTGRPAATYAVGWPAGAIARSNSTCSAFVARRD